MAHKTASPARLEAFSDGVIAVIVTIMVLELKVPRENGIQGLRTILPTLAVPTLSFAFTGNYWINYHHLVHRTVSESRNSGGQPRIGTRITTARI